MLENFCERFETVGNLHDASLPRVKGRDAKYFLPAFIHKSGSRSCNAKIEFLWFFIAINLLPWFAKHFRHIMRFFDEGGVAVTILKYNWHWTDFNKIWSLSTTSQIYFQVILFSTSLGLLLIGKLSALLGIPINYFLPLHLHLRFGEQSDPKLS